MYRTGRPWRIGDPRDVPEWEALQEVSHFEESHTATTQQVWQWLLRSEPMFILDVRNRDEFERWRTAAAWPAHPRRHDGSLYIEQYPDPMAS